MQNVYDLAHELARSLKETDQYKDFKANKAKIDANEALKNMIDDFTKQNYEIQTSIMSGKQPDEELLKKTQATYAVVMQDPTCAAYLNSEMALSQIVTDISKILSEAIE